MTSAKILEKHDQKLGFQNLEKLKAYIDERYYQLRLMPHLSFHERQKIFKRYDSSLLLKLLTKLREREVKAEFVERKVLSPLVDRVVYLLTAVEKEREEQLKRGLYPADKSSYNEHIRLWKGELLKKLKTINIPKNIEKRLSASILAMEGLHSIVVPTHVNENPSIKKESSHQMTTLLDYHLEELFYEIFAGESIKKEALFRFLELNSENILTFLEHKLETDVKSERRNALELVRFIKRKQAIVLVSRTCIHDDDQKIKLRALEILNWMSKQQYFSKNIKLIHFCLDQIKTHENKPTLSEKEKKEIDFRKNYFKFLNSADEEQRATMIKAMTNKDYVFHRSLIQEAFNKENSLFIKSMILSGIARYRVEELYSLFEGALENGCDKTIYHAILAIKEHSFVEMIPILMDNTDHLNYFNQLFASQVIKQHQ
ncbi:MAG: hypothetical protein COB02_12640 [Candidatus Cloacimonadota bacterium]|nr:MAG: hypothetical protein COB02_12640 [Candidatus Cloacimonadota bacterium]